MLYNNILETIGKTPLIRLRNVGKGLQCHLFGKCEFLNPGGSVKDRIAYSMIRKGEREKRIRPGDTLIEATSGNTGIGIALVGAILGYKVIITMPDKMSQEKQVVLKALGAKVIRTPSDAPWDSSQSHINVAKKLNKSIPRSHILDQYSNSANPLVHYEQTAQEILDDLEGEVSMVVLGVGTGGSITGVAQKIKEKCPQAFIVGADPEGSLLAGPEEIKPYHVEGIGYDFIPKVLERGLVDEWVKTNDSESFKLARELIRKEGLLVGGSSGSALQATLKMAPRLKKNENCVLLLPDGVRNYMSKFLNDDWMEKIDENQINKSL